MSIALVSSKARTVAERLARSSSAVSPKGAPGLKVINSWPPLTTSTLPLTRMKKSAPPHILTTKTHVPRLIRADVHDVEDFDKFMRIAETKQADAFQRLDFPSDGDTRFAPCALDSVNLHGNNSDIVAATTCIRQGDTGGHQTLPGQARAHLRQLLLTCEIVMEAIRAEQEAIMGHTFNK